MEIQPPDSAASVLAQHAEAIRIIGKQVIADIIDRRSASHKDVRDCVGNLGAIPNK